MCRFLLSLGLGIIGGLFTTVSLAAELPERPNLIWIMADDLGYGDLGCFGQQVIQTPRIDRMAAEGMKLTDVYAGCTVCRPSRLVLWTGLHTGHTAISSNAQYVFKPEDVTVAELLQAAGYATGGIGKWAMGGVETTGHPQQNGFDYWMGYLDQGEAHNSYPTHLWRNTTKVPLPGNIIGDYPNGRGRVSSQRVTYSHDVLFGEGLQFIRDHADGPFLFHAHVTIPHANNEGGRVTGDGMEVPDYGIYASEDWPNPEKGFAATISRLDGDVGRLFDLLAELDIEKQTLVIFTSDNGPHQEGGHKHEFFDSNGPLRGYKRDLYEGGIREPTIVRWPGVVESNSSSAELIAFQDWLPTACELAGIETPDHTDGRSFVPTLIGQPRESHESLYFKYGKKEAVRRGNWKAVRLKPTSPIALYNLTDDLGETTDVSDEHPKIVAEMTRLMAESVADQQPAEK